jgi:hypothetical protein
MQGFSGVHDAGAGEGSPFDEAVAGTVGAFEEFGGELAFGLELAEFGDGLMEQAVSLGAGAVDGYLDTGGIGVAGFHGIEDVVFAVVEAEDEMRFNFATAGETPGRAVDFVGEQAFEFADGGEVANEGVSEACVDGLFAGADEVAGEQAEGDGVFRGNGAACAGTRTG